MAVIRLGAKDWQEFRTLRLQALEEAPEAFTSAYEFETAQAEDYFKDRLSLNAIFSWREENALLASVGLAMHKTQPKIAHKAQLWGVYVQPQSTRRGIATALIQAAEKHARENEIVLIQLGVAENNLPALNLYKNLGYVPYGLEEKALKVNGAWVNDIWMAKTL